MQAELTGVGSVAWPEGHRWCCDIQEAGGSEVREKVMISNEEETELQGSKGTAHFVIRFGGKGSREAYCTVEQAPASKLCKGSYTEGDSGTWVPVVVLECRGMEPVRWHPQGGFTVTSAGEQGTEFPDADLSEDWCEYDDADDLSLEVMEVQGEWRPVK